MRCVAVVLSFRDLSNKDRVGNIMSALRFVPAPFLQQTITLKTAGQGQSDLDIVFTMIFAPLTFLVSCEAHIHAHLISKLYDLMFNSKVINSCFNPSAQRLMVKTT